MAGQNPMTTAAKLAAIVELLKDGDTWREDVSGADFVQDVSIIIDTPTAPDATLPLFLYRTPETDEDGDPLDWGAVIATHREEAETLITARFTEIGLFGHWCEALDVKVYDCGLVPTVASVLGSTEITRATLRPKGGA